MDLQDAQGPHCGPCCLLGCGARLLMRGNDRVDHLADHALLGDGQRSDLFKLLRDLGLWPALAGAALADRCADEFFHAGAERGGGLRQGLHRDAGDAALVVRHRLLGDAEGLGQPA